MGIINHIESIVDKLLRRTKLVLHSARIVVDKAEEVIDGVREEIREHGAEKERPPEQSD